jgi:hypothetical protein
MELTISIAIIVVVAGVHLIPLVTAIVTRRSCKHIAMARVVSFGMKIFALSLAGIQLLVQFAGKSIVLQAVSNYNATAWAARHWRNVGVWWKAVIVLVCVSSNTTLGSTHYPCCIFLLKHACTFIFS